MSVAPRSGGSWQFFDHGLLVFQNPLACRGSPRLLVSQLKHCTAPDCPCRDVRLRTVSFELPQLDLVRAHLALEGLRSKFAGGDAMSGRLDIDLGLVHPDPGGGRVPLSVEWAAHLQAHIDGELLDVLNEQWLRAKSMPSAPRTNWSPRTPEELVSWDEAHPDDREDLYLDDGAQIIAEDLYCLKPGCTCSEVRVAFRNARTARS